MNTRKEIEVSKIEVKIGDTIIPLTLEQIRSLKDLLNDLFPEPITYPLPYPVITYPERHYPWWEPTVTYTCGSNTLAIEGKIQNQTQRTS